MQTEFVTTNVTRYDSAKNIFVPDTKFTSVENCFELRLNGQHFRKVFCSPNCLDDLAIGMLAQTEKIFSIDDVIRLDVDAENFLIDVETAPVEKVSVSDELHDDLRFSAKNILACADKLLGELSTTHAKTNGVHSGLLFDGEKILFVREDIGRHNVFDKIHGAAIRERLNLRDKVLIFSGRCSSEMMLKLWRMKIPVVAAKSVPTTYSIELAKKLGITLAARMAAGSFCIYTNPKRIVLEEG